MSLITTRLLSVAGLCGLIVTPAVAPPAPLTGPAPLLYSAPGAASAPRDSISTCGPLGTPIHQQINPTSGASLLTRWEQEARSAAAHHGFTLAVPDYFHAAAGAGPTVTPVYRLYRAASGDFTWSTHASDTQSLKDRGYVAQRVDFHAYAAATSGSTPLHRVVNGAMTRMALTGDVPGLVKQGWSDTGAKFHVAPRDCAPPAPAPTPTAPAPAPTPKPAPTPAPKPAPAPPADAPADADGKFSLAIYPDTQMEVTDARDQRLENRTQRVIAQRSARDIRYVLHMGDVVNWDTASAENPDHHEQYDNATRQLQPLEQAGLPWAPTIGNHDTYAVGPTGGSARSGVDVRVAVRNTRTFNQYFPVSRFRQIAGVAEPGKVDNVYRTFRAAGRDWLILTLELWPRQPMIDWADKVIADHPRHNVIVTTHGYLTDKGRLQEDNGGYGATSPRHLWDSVLSRHRNVKLVLSGHAASSATLQQIGEGGNMVGAVVSCWHSRESNHVRYLEIDVNKGTLTSTVEEPWLGKLNPVPDQIVMGFDFVR